jgi:2'-5' RNA ligase
MNKEKATENKRLFIAVNLPEQLKGEIFERLLKRLPRQDVKAVEKENLHLTMRFLGYLNSEAEEELKKKMLSLSEMMAFVVSLEGIGEFHGRVLWIGVKKGKEELEEIAKRIAKLIGGTEEDFSAHLTICRNKLLKRKDFSGLAERLGKENFFGEFRAESVELMESKLSPSGPKYSVAFSVKLSAV